MSSRIFRERLRFVPRANPSALMRIDLAVCCVMVEPPWMRVRRT